MLSTEHRLRRGREDRARRMIAKVYGNLPNDGSDPHMSISVLVTVTSPHSSSYPRTKCECGQGYCSTGVTHVPVRVSSAQLLIQHPAQAPADGSPCRLEYSGLCHSGARPAWSSWNLTSAWPSPGCYGHLGSEPVHRRFLCVCVCCSTFQIN